MRTLQVGLALIREEVPPFCALHMAGAVLAAIPVVLVSLNLAAVLIQNPFRHGLRPDLRRDFRRAP